MNARSRGIVLGACLVVAAVEAPRAGAVFTQDVEGLRARHLSALARSSVRTRPAERALVYDARHGENARAPSTSIAHGLPRR